MENVNYLALLLSAVAAMIIGSVWYGPLFGKVWMKGAKISDADMKASASEMPKVYGITFIAALVQAYVLSVFINYAGVSDYVSGAMVAFWAWLGFVVVVKLYDVLFEKRPTNLFTITIGYQLITLVVMSAIIISL